MDVALRQDGDRVLIPVRARPRSGRNELGRILEDGRLEVRLKAAPVDGAANEELLRFLGRKVLGIAPSALSLVRGEKGRDKLVAVSGLTRAEILVRLVPG